MHYRNDNFRNDNFKNDRRDPNPYQTDIENLSMRLGQLLLNRDKNVVTVESCTGGGVATAITDIPGSSMWFDSALVTYTNEAKVKLAHVPISVIEENGAVSIEVAEAMAVGGLENNRASYSIAITGVAGPDGGTAEKPVGTVCFAWAERSKLGIEILHSEVKKFEGNRKMVRLQSTFHGMDTLCRLVD